MLGVLLPLKSPRYWSLWRFCLLRERRRETRGRKNAHQLLDGGLGYDLSPIHGRGSGDGHKVRENVGNLYQSE